MCGSKRYATYYKYRDADVKAALDALDDCKTGQDNTVYFEFSLMGPVFTGGQTAPGDDRVVAIATGTETPFSNFVY